LQVFGVKIAGSGWFEFNAPVGDGFGSRDAPHWKWIPPEYPLLTD